MAVIPRSRAQELVPVLLAAADRAAAKRDCEARIHVVPGAEEFVPAEDFERLITVHRADGEQQENRAGHLPEARLGQEWEWEATPELTVTVVDSLEAGVALFNRYSPQFVSTLIAEDDTVRASFEQGVNAPFVGDGFTRWVDGQYALGQTELGLSNWERGRLLARSGVLTGADLTARRLFARHSDPGQHR